MNTKVDVLGTEYTLTVCSEKDEPRLQGMNGFCDDSTKEMVVDSFADVENELESKKNLLRQVKKNIRHEIIHAFLFESGLAENSEWAQNEEMVDFFAIQFPKLLRAFREVDAL